MFGCSPSCTSAWAWKVIHSYLLPARHFPSYWTDWMSILIHSFGALQLYQSQLCTLVDTEFINIKSKHKTINSLNGYRALHQINKTGDCMRDSWWWKRRHEILIHEWSMSRLPGLKVNRPVTIDRHELLWNVIDYITHYMLKIVF